MLRAWNWFLLVLGCMLLIAGGLYPLWREFSIFSEKQAFYVAGHWCNLAETCLAAAVLGYLSLLVGLMTPKALQGAPLPTPDELSRRVQRTRRITAVVSLLPLVIPLVLFFHELSSRDNANIYSRDYFVFFCIFLVFAVGIFLPTWCLTPWVAKASLGRSWPHSLWRALAVAAASLGMAAALVSAVKTLHGLHAYQRSLHAIFSDQIEMVSTTLLYGSIPAALMGVLCWFVIRRTMH